MINCYAFGAVPPFVQGLVRDLRVRWALEEAGLPYRVTLVGYGDGMTPLTTYKSVQPFGQVPAIEDGPVVLFESGAIVLYVAEKSRDLLPGDAAGRAHVTQWMFAALNTMEPAIDQLAGIDLFYAGEAWAQARRPAVEEFVRRRLADLAGCLGDRPYLAGSFSAADILMAAVLRTLRHTDLVAAEPVLRAYKERCEARPAFTKALAGHMAPFASAASAG
jgi:glutathione S-transferase